MRFQLEQPTGVQVDRNGNLLVADLKLNEVFLFSQTGLLLKRLLKPDCCLQWEDEEAHSVPNEPTGLLLDQVDNNCGHLYVSNKKGGSVLVYEYLS